MMSQLRKPQSHINDEGPRYTARYSGLSSSQRVSVRPPTAAAIIGRVAVRQTFEERLERRLELRRVDVILDPDIAARDARLDLLDPALRERLRWLPRGLVDPSTVLPVAHVPVRVVLRAPVEHRPHVASLRSIEVSCLLLLHPAVFGRVAARWQQTLVAGREVVRRFVPDVLPRR
jgi:hypothetical protein